MPALFFVLSFSAHHEYKDFDQVPDVLKNTPYEDWEDTVLQKIERLRSIPYQSINLCAHDGTPLYARWYARGEKTAILMHGFHSTAFNNFFAIAEEFLDAGWSVLMPDMRGSGKSGGRFTLGLKEAEDALAWANWVAGQPDCTNIVMYGVSMGGAAITFAADSDWPDKVRALIVDAGYYDARQQIYNLKQLRYVPKRIFLPLTDLFSRLILNVRIGTNGLDALKHAKRPMYFIAGSKDTTIDPSIVETSYRACNAVKEYFNVKDAPHTLAFLVGGDALKTSVFNFIQQYTERKDEK